MKRIFVSFVFVFLCKEPAVFAPGEGGEKETTFEGGSSRLPSKSREGEIMKCFIIRSLPAFVFILVFKYR